MNAALRIAAWLLALALVALPVVAVVNGWVGSERWPLTRLRVAGELQHLDPAQLRAAVLPQAQRGYFAIRLAEARKAIEQLPWVERAEVRKRWPDVLEIHVVEHQPFARWGEDQLLSASGRLFPLPVDLPVDTLPRLSGPDARAQEVVALYNQAGQLFAPLGLRVPRLGMDARGSWSLWLDNGAGDAGIEVVVGRADAQPRLARFARMLPQLLERQVLHRADLRYTNGFALSEGT